MRWFLTEYLLKGIFIGLLLFVALQEPSWPATGKVALAAFGGLILFLGIAAARKLREGYRVRGRLPAFVLFLVLESPGLIYAGVLLGLLAGAYWNGVEGRQEQLAAMMSGGAALGLVCCLLRSLHQRWARFALTLLLACGLVAGILWWLDVHFRFLHDPQRATFGVLLLMGIPLFYVLTFAGLAEESEVEIGIMCAALGLALWALMGQMLTTQWLIFLVPLAIYYAYTTRVLPRLGVFKYVVRGIGHATVGRYRPALKAYRRALQLDPGNALARDSLWNLHRSMDLQEAASDPETLALIDYDLCLERVTSLLLKPAPSPERLAEAHHLLDLIASQRTALRPVADYWRAVAFTHARQYEQATASLERVLGGAGSDGARSTVLLPAWQLALTLHPELNRRCGTPQLALPGRRLEAIGAVERQLAGNPDDSATWDLKRLLYSTLTEAEYIEAAGPEQPLKDFDHGYAHQLGLALISDPARWQRGAEYLRVAARGLPALGPTIFQQVALAHQRAGHNEEVWQNYEHARRVGQAVGSKNLGEEDRQTYFGIVKMLGEDARSRNDLDAAIENYRLLAESERSGLETLRILADLYERQGNVFGALRTTEQALVFNARDKDFLERKDRYYYSLMPAELRERADTIRGAFDVDYCVRKARALLDFKEAEPDLLDWAQHLVELAQVTQPDSLSIKVLRARVLRRRGEVEPARLLLEEVYAGKPEAFATSADEEAWFLACRLLGETYLYELARPDLAVPCFQAFRTSPRSGADTMYKLGLAYEQLGDRARATKYYQLVTAYEDHPRAPDAREALYRLQSN